MSRTTHCEDRESDQKTESCIVVGIGTSAGGLGALRKFFANVPVDSGIAFVVVMHLSPAHESHLAEILQPDVRIPVRQVCQTVALQPNQVYVIPPGRNLSAIDTHLRLDELEAERAQRAPIDHFLRTLAETHDGDSIAVILTGTGSDGTLGLKEIKECGGVVVVQDPKDAEYDGMPQSALATGLADVVLPLAKIPAEVLRLAQSRPQVQLPVNGDALTDHQSALLQKIFAQIRARVGRDFTSYKRSTILRRIVRRMQLGQVGELGDYLARLRNEPDEAQALADDLLITVTNFFRDAEVYDRLENTVVPSLFDGKQSGDEVRVWSVGCATGEEAYSLAILLLEYASRLEMPPRVQIFASDLHERSLSRAREGFYPGDITSDVSPQRIKRFFTKESGGYRIRKEIRQMVVFTPHNLLGDPPFSRLDLVSCRNVLIYLQRGIQKDIIDLFHYSLCPDGWLVLGTSETIENSELFITEHKKDCIYRKRNVPAPEPRLPVFPLTTGRLIGEKRLAEQPSKPIAYGTLHARMVERYAPPSLLVSPDDKVVHMSEHAGRYLVHPGGELTANVLKLVREELRIELRSILHSARERRIPIAGKSIEVRFNGDRAMVTMDARPAIEPTQEGFVLVILDEQPLETNVESTPDASVSPQHRSSASDGQESVRIAELEGELDLTRHRLQSIVEEYETSQEEMKASNEELQSTNEELRSTMEELETSKEELQSMNEELQTVNQENRHKVEELAQLSSDLQNLLAATDIATLFLDRDMRILRFTPAIGDLFSVRLADRGRLLSDFTHRLGYDELLSDCGEVLKSLIPIECEVQDNSGHWYLTRVLPYRSTEDRIEGIVITFVDITRRKSSEENLRLSQERYRLLVENATEYAIFMTDSEARITLWNRGAERMFGYAESEVIGRSITMLGTEQDRSAGRLNAELDAARQDGHSASERWQQRRDGSTFWGGGVITAIKNDQGSFDGFAYVIRDNTERSRSEVIVRESEARLRLACEATGFGSYDFDIQKNQLIWSPELYRIMQLPPDTPVAPSHLLTHVHPDDQEDFDRLYQKAIRPGGEEHHNHQFRVVVEGKTRWLRDTGHTFFVGEGDQRKAVRVVGMVQDVTAQKEYEESLEQARRAAEAANQSRGEFLANMSHEIRTPMTAIIGHVDILSEVLSDPEHRGYLETIRRNGQFLLHIINDILDLSKIDAGRLLLERDRVRIDELLSDLRSLLDVRAESKGLDFTIEFDGLVPETIEIDAIRLRQILLNLLGNAIKFTETGSVRLVVRYLAEPTQLQFDVIDTGIGISQDLIDSLFQPFVQADASTTRHYGGTGLGLTICRRFARMFGGDISVESQPGRGSKFSLVVDCGPSDNVRHIRPNLDRMPTQPIDEENIRIDGTILIADDRRDIRFLAARILENAGARIETADNGRHAVDRVRQAEQSGIPFDLILMDMQMPEMDGYEATRTLRHEGYKCPIIALTANAMQGDRDACLRAGCSDYLSKPINSGELLQIAWRLLLRTDGENHANQ